jgi:hypothetical protein
VGEPLPLRQWFPANHRALSDFIAHFGRAAGVAVFDWDNTCIFNDIGDATFRRQLGQLALALTPTELDALLPGEVAGVTTLCTGASMAALGADIRAAYTVLWPHIRAGNPKAGLETPAHHDFRAKVGHLYEGLVSTPGIGAVYAYRWLTRLWGGFTPEQVRALAADTVRAAGDEPVGHGSWQAATGGAAGKVAFSFRTHVQPHPEIFDLMRALEGAGIAVYVVTASLEDVVRGAAATWAAPVASERIFGMRLATRSPRLAPEPAPDYPVTYRAGKVEVIQRFLPSAPILVAGDHNTDYEMLTGFPETRMRLVINRNGSGDIRSLYGAALAPAGPGPVTLLQGRDENRGAFRPGRETIPAGAAEPVAL